MTRINWIMLPRSLNRGQHAGEELSCRPHHPGRGGKSAETLFTRRTRNTSWIDGRHFVALDEAGKFASRAGRKQEAEGVLIIVLPDGRSVSY